MHLSNLNSELKARRKSLNVTQEMLADISGVGLRTIKQFESGKGNPTLDTICTLVDTLGLKIGVRAKNQAEIK
jgi:transcriptional regulator with XRE-family HTH domain